jgi:hypothetical protein
MPLQPGPSPCLRHVVVIVRQNASLRVLQCLSFAQHDQRHTCGAHQLGPQHRFLGYVSHAPPCGGSYPRRNFCAPARSMATAGRERCPCPGLDGVPMHGDEFVQHHASRWAWSEPPLRSANQGRNGAAKLSIFAASIVSTADGAVASPPLGIEGAQDGVLKTCSAVPGA